MRRIALVGYPAEYFLPFAKALESKGFEVFWVSVLNADARHLERNGVSSGHVLNVNAGFQPGTKSLEECGRELATFENDSDPKINDIILMDRLISRKNWRFSVQYLHHVATSVSRFYQQNEIGLVSSWRDTAVQMVSMLAARREGIPFVIPTRIRIPQEIYGFCTAHHTESFIPLRAPDTRDVEWANQFLLAFQSRGVAPALKKATRNFSDILRLMPSHLRAFSYEFRRSFADVGNDYTRYPISRLLAMYLTRRVNLVRYKLRNPAERDVLPDQQYCLYTLHTQPESSIDVQGSYFSNQIELIRHIIRSLPATHRLYVKVHPTDVDGKPLEYYRSIKQIPGVVLVDYSVDTRTLLKNASIVFALTGTIAYEAGLLHKPVVVFARNYFNALPTIHRCDAPTQLPALVGKLLSDYTPPPDYRDRTVSFLAALRASCFDGEVSRTYGASNEGLRQSDLEELQRAYETVYAALMPERRS